MDKTFAETEGYAPFDWNKFLDQAIDGNASLRGREQAENCAKSWTTCACGNQCAIIPREVSGHPSSHGYPLDMELRQLGHQFYQAITIPDYKFARKILAQIEARSAELIAVELAKLNSCSTSLT